MRRSMTLWPRRSRLVQDDPRLELLARAQQDPRLLSVVEFLDRSAGEQPADALLASDDGRYFRDTKPPFLIADQTAITGTAEALLWPADFTKLPANYFGFAGKMLKLTAFGKITTAGSSQGNLTLTARYGTTTGGTSLGASAATALAASKTNITWSLEVYVACRSQETTGSSTGSVIAFGKFLFDGAGAVFTTAAQMPLLIPASAAAATTIDTTVAGGIVVGATLGSASDTMSTQLLVFEALN